MNKQDKAQIYESLDRMSTEYSNFMKVMIKIFKNSFKNKNLKRTFLVILFGLVLLPIILYISNSIFTYKYIEIIINETNDLMISLFAISFTGYALFQALTSGYTLTSLLKTKDKTYNKFEEFNLSFFSLNLFILFIITINYILKISMPIIKDTNFINNIKVDKNIIACIFIYFYIVFVMYLLLEMKSFIFNLFQCFNFNAIAHGIDVLKNSKENDK